MNRFSNLLISFLMILSLVIFGCSSSEETQQEQEATEQQETQQEAQKVSQEMPPPPPSGESDTIDVTKREEYHTEVDPSYKQNTTEQASSASGTYAVQIGAFKMPEKAEEIAAIARQRFTMEVRSFMDKETGLTKVLIGSFASKEDARTFRDQLAKQFPNDYQDAWVTEIPKQ